MNLRVLVVDDEPPARQRIEDLLRDDPDVEIVGAVGSGEAAVNRIRTLSPDLVFLDVQMPKGSGLDVIRSIGPLEMPAVIFVTAYDRYALEAFDSHAVDYLLKPFSDDRFTEAVTRVREQLRLRRIDAARGRLQELLAEPAAPAASRASYLDRLPIDVRDETIFLPVTAVDYIVAEGPYAEVYSGGERYLLRERMHQLERQLDPERFVRIHRSTIVNLARVVALEGRSGRDAALRLRDGARLKVSRARRDTVEAALRGIVS